MKTRTLARWWRLKARASAHSRKVLLLPALRCRAAATATGCRRCAAAVALCGKGSRGKVEGVHVVDNPQSMKSGGSEARAVREGDPEVRLNAAKCGKI